ncbi:sugar porter (SP) family MFS transporter [Herbihabitans rhizosphaerae]|uniref:Sugar porter (SP) family MFS transporter n=1 Tax=Herbihabitans rhizosphaerae TaxID=1872711 RepID=A0A4Q7KHT6_9PSEU|nr:sugar porter family MFS transporter [Herbihabitans rhizosphaerae]RZS32827.1 sugar porter (SP) family MFS transporter [Herbihabitans rhizosphaerae]
MATVGDSTQITTPGLRGGRAFYVFGALGAVLYGYDTGIIGGAMLFIHDEWEVSPFAEGLITSCILVGAMIGALGGGPLADRYGRRKVIAVCSVIFVLGALASAVATGVGTLVAARTGLGLAVGGASVIVPLYLAEMAPTRIRGAIATLNQTLIIVGVGLAALVAYVAQEDKAWRTAFAIGVIPAVALLIGLAFMPETPRWLIRRGREPEARAVLAITRDSSTVDSEIADIRRVEDESSGTVGVRGILANRWILGTLAIGAGLAVAQQLTGINTIVYYQPTLLKQLGATQNFALLFGVINTIPNLIAVAFAARLVDRVGRKPLLIWGTVGTAVGMFLLGLPKVLDAPSGVTTTFAVIGLVVFTVTFSLTWGPVLWVMLSEIFPLNVRGTAMGIATIANWIMNFTVSLTMPVLADAWGIGTLFIVYGFFGVLLLIFVRRWVPETKGRSLEQIETDFRTEGARG